MPEDQKLTDQTLRDMLLPKIKDSAALKEDLAHFKRVGRSHADHSYTCLMDAMRRWMDDQNRERVDRDRKASLRGGKCYD